MCEEGTGKRVAGGRFSKLVGASVPEKSPYSAFSM